MNNISDRELFETDPERQKTDEAQPEPSRESLVDQAPHHSSVGARDRTPGSQTSSEIDPAGRDQAVLALVTHWQSAGSGFGSALISDLRILFGFTPASIDTRRRLSARIAAGALVSA